MDAYFLARTHTCTSESIGNRFTYGDGSIAVVNTNNLELLVSPSPQLDGLQLVGDGSARGSHSPRSPGMAFLMARLQHQVWEAAERTPAEPAEEADLITWMVGW